VEEGDDAEEYVFGLEIGVLDGGVDVGLEIAVVSMTPLGSPEVPEVYMRTARSSVLGTGISGEAGAGGTIWASCWRSMIFRGRSLRRPPSWGMVMTVSMPLSWMTWAISRSPRR